MLELVLFMVAGQGSPDGVFLVIGVAAPLIITLVSLYAYARGTKRKRLIEDTPTSKVKGVFIGLNEVKGKADLIINMNSYLSELLCCFYAYSIQEHYTRTRRVRDKDGNWRTETYSGWETVASGSNRVPFDLEDETGDVRVIPRDAEMEGNTVFARTCGRGDALYYDKGPAYAVSGSNFRRQFRESAIIQDDQLYVLGSARLADESARVEIAKERDIYLISVKSEEQLVKKYAWMVRLGWLGVVAGFALSPISIGCLLMRMSFEDIWFWMIPFGLLGMLVNMLVYVLYVFNGLVSTKVRLARAWSLIDIQLKRRYDLIGNLVEVCKSFLEHEREVQELVAGARSGKYQQGEAPSQQQITSTSQATTAQNQVIDQLFALREAYPDLKASQPLAKLHKLLVDCEDRLAIARSFYNEGAGNYNERIRRVPEVMFARFMGYDIATYYEIAAAHSKPVDVDALLEEDKSAEVAQESTPPELMGEEEETVVLALVCMMSADGEIAPSEYAAFEKFVADATGNDDIGIARQKAQAALQRVKQETIDVVVAECVEKLSALKGSSIAERFTESLDAIVEANGSVTEAEFEMIRRFREAVADG